jgi:hypothetical protein
MMRLSYLMVGKKSTRLSHGRPSFGSPTKAGKEPIQLPWGEDPGSMQAEHPLHHLDASERTDWRRSEWSQTDVSFHDQQSVASVPCGQFRRTEAVDNAQVRLVRERVADDPPPRGTNGDEAVPKSAAETAKTFESALVGEHDERRVAPMLARSVLHIRLGTRPLFDGLPLQATIPLMRRIVDSRSRASSQRRASFVSLRHRASGGRPASPNFASAFK